ncbi:MAG: DUF3108 domain-containing protein, partial [Planctomycetota bacterium]
HTRPAQNPDDAPFRWAELPSGTTSEHLVGKTLQYSISLNGVPAGDAEIAFVNMNNHSASENGMAIQYKAQTTATFAWAFSWETTGVTWAHRNDLLPRISYRHTIENGESEHSWMKFDRIRRSASHIKMKSDDSTPDYSELSFAHGFNWPTLFARLASLRVLEGERPTFDVIDGDRAYVVQVINTGQRASLSMERGAYTSRKLKIIITRLIAENDGQDTPSHRPNSAHIWVDDQTHLPLKIQYRSPLGRITAVLASDVPGRNDM